MNHLRKPRLALRAVALLAALSGGLPAVSAMELDRVFAAPLSELGFVQALVERNLELAYAKRSVLVAETLASGESGVYEPILYGTVKHAQTQRQRNVEEMTSSFTTAGEAKLDEESRQMELGVRGKTEAGGELSLSAKRSERKSNILLKNGTDLEVSTAISLSYRQPLLRGRGQLAVEVDWQVARLEALATAWQYRQQLQKVTAESLSLFWQVVTADQIVAYRERLLRNASTLLEAGRERVSAGKLAPLALVDLQREQVAREADLLRAKQTRDEVRLRVLSNLDAPAKHLEDLALRARYEQDLAPKPIDLTEALSRWAPYQVARIRMLQGSLRLQYADNQSRPAADVIMGYNQTGLADTKGAWDLAKSTAFPDWFVGLNMELGLWGERKATAQKIAQQERVRQSDTELAAIASAFRNDWATRQRAWERAGSEIRLLKAELQRRQEVWQAEQARAEQGLSTASSVMLLEQDVLDSEIRLVDAQGRAEAARLSLMLAQGELLKHYGVTYEVAQGL